MFTPFGCLFFNLVFFKFLLFVYKIQMIFVDDGHNPEIVCAISGSPDRQSSDNCTDDSTSAD